MNDVRLVPIDDIKLSGENMRLDAGDIDELAESIATIGLLQPLVLTEDLVLVCGHRRLAASRLAGLTKVPATVRAFTEDQAFVALFTENVHRRYLSPVEEGLALKKFADRGYTQQAIAKIIGKSQMYVSNRLAVLKLSESMQDAIHRGDVGLHAALNQARNPRSGKRGHGIEDGSTRWQASYADRMIGWIEGGRIPDDARVEDKLRRLFNALKAFFRTDDELSDDRLCRHPGCETKLSRFNPGIYCGAHEREHSTVAS